jgi:3',5'-cyclic AMP phosphodiesterase CpdA
MTRGRVTARGLAGVAALAAVAGGAEAGPRMLKGPYLQDVAPTSIRLLWQLEEARPARVLVEGPGGRRELAIAAAWLSEAAIGGLAPSSRYRYRVVVDDRSWEGELATAPPRGQDVPITFAVLGDSRYGVEPHRRIVERIAREAPAFVLGTGDVVDEGSRQDQWQQFFDVQGALMHERVYYPAVGNHDRQGRGRTADNYRSYFAVPESAGDAERYYAFTYATSRFLVLDSNVSSFALTDQTAWLERELIAARQDAGVRHVFVVMHHPPYSISLHGGAKELRERWGPLFERYGVSAVFSGHDHVYERAERDGVRYFVTGGGGAALYPKRPKSDPLDAEAVQRFERAFHYLRVAITGRRVEVTGIRIDGTAIETTSWTDAAAALPARSRPQPPQPASASAGAPPPTAASAGAPPPSALAIAEAPAVPAAGGGSPFLWLGLAAVGGLLGAAVVVTRTLRR